MALWNAKERGEPIPTYAERPLWLSAQLEVVDFVITTIRHKQTKDADLGKLSALQTHLIKWLEKDNG